MKQIETHQKGVAKRRDQLDEFIDELTDLRESCDDAWNALQTARDSLSELV